MLNTALHLTVFARAQFILLDSSGFVGYNSIEGLTETFKNLRLQSTGGSDCMKQHIADLVEFLSDLHTLSRLKVLVV